MQTKGEGLDAHESPLLTDQRVRDASPDQQPGVTPGDPAPDESLENPASD